MLPQPPLDDRRDPAPSPAGAVLDALPRPAAARLAVRVTRDAVRQLRNGHPWLYEGSIRSVDRTGSPGDLAVVFDDDRRFVAIGLWDPASPIRLKVLQRNRPAQIDVAWFRARLEEAVAIREPLHRTAGTQGATTAYRVVHGENDGLPGLVVDRYGDVAVLKLYTAAWIPHLAVLVPLVGELLGLRSIVLRLARSLHDQARHGLEEGMSLLGPEVTTNVEFLEHGLRFEADVRRGQKTGHFLDQRDNRALVGSMAAGASVLDVFSCTGGFTVHAAAGGARAVRSVDSSPGAIELARRNVQLNANLPAVAACAHDTVVGEAFGVLEGLVEARARFDLVVVDPPSFTRAATGVDRALAAYARLTTLALALVQRGGTLFQASCSSRVAMAEFVRTVHAAAGEAGYDLEEVARTGHPVDHPIGFPEGEYLKALVVRPARRPGARADPRPRARR